MMPLLIVPLASDETDSLTLAEWDLLRRCERVMFERPGHPLAARLREHDVETGPVDDDPSAEREGWALVADPDSPRVVELARQGARVTAGPVHPPDDLTAAHGSYIGRSATSSLGRLAVVMARLRSSDGCPWDREQSHASLRAHLIEEANEVLEAIDHGAVGEELEEELGDLLLQVVFHAQMASDDGRFDIAGVADRIVGKLVHRHPHVFGDTEVAGAAEVVKNWEAIKAEEKERSDPFEGIPASLSALLAAYKTQKRAAGAGFDADQQRARAELKGALNAPADDETVGRALFWLVALARAAGVDPEGALRSATARFQAALKTPDQR